MRWAPPSHLIKQIASYAGLVGKIDGDVEANYAISRAITELVEMGLASIPQDRFVLLRAKRCADQMRSKLWQVHRNLMLDMVRQFEDLYRQMHNELDGGPLDLGDVPRLALTPEARSDRIRPVTGEEAEALMAQISESGDPRDPALPEEEF